MARKNEPVVTEQEIDEALGRESVGDDGIADGVLSGQAENVPQATIQDSGGGDAPTGRELARRPGALVSGRLALNHKDELKEMACNLSAANMALGEARRPAEIFLALLAGSEAGLTISQSVKNVAVIKGRATIWGDALAALVLAHDEYAGHTETIDGEGDDRACTVTITRHKRLWDGSAARFSRTVSFSVADAKSAGLWGKAGPWKSHPDRMLRNRAVTFAFRDMFADVVGGLSVREDVEDYRAFEPERMRGPAVDDDTRAAVAARQAKEAK